MQRAAVIANPSKLRRPDQLRAEIESTFRGHGWADPLWLETTVEDSGAGQAGEAMAQGVDLVTPLGGDGTVRCVASALRGTDTPMALLPAGTGNLLARNLGLSVRRRYAQALRRAINGRDRRLDVGVIEVDRGDTVEEQVFLVMCGMGLDADMLGGTPEALKERLGWMAYVVSGARHLRTPPVEMEVIADAQRLGKAPVTSVIIGNCGTLTGGVRLMPAAQPDDGRLDGVVLAAATLPQWGRLITQVLSRRGNEVQVRHLPAQSFELIAAEPRPVEVDGDILPAASHMRVRVEPRALLLRVP